MLRSPVAGCILLLVLCVTASAAVPGNFTLSNQTPVCDTSPPVGPAVRLNWTSASGATTYEVYRNAVLYSSGVPSGTLTFNNNANLAPGQTYTYFVRARNSSGTTDSNTISVPISSTICASVPGNFTLSNQTPVCNTSPPAGPAVQLNWTPASGATTYEVYRNSVLYSPGVPSGTLTFNNNANLTAGQTYTYFVRARNSSGTTDSNTISVPISSTICGSVPGNFTLSNQAPVCNASPPAGPAVQLNWTPASGATTYEVYRNAVLYSPGVPSGTLTFNNNANLTAGQTYTYFVRARNSSGTNDSNTISVPISSTICGSVPSITLHSTSPSSPAAGQQFTLNISGNNFNSSTAQILFTGPGCSPCTVPNGVLTTTNATLLIGPVTLNTVGNYTVSVQNGAGGAISNGLSLTIGGATPSLGSLSTNPSPPVVQQQFTLTINGSSFDPNTVQILVFGTNCGPCTVPNGALTSKTATQIGGPVTLSSGSFNITAQNGSGGGQSNSLSLTVGAATPLITLHSTSPSSPAAGQQFTINVSGNNFNSAMAQILFTGPGCSPCTVPNGVLSTKNATLLIGPVTLNAVGNYMVSVQNGPGGAISNGLSLAIGGATPSLGSLITNPSPPVVGQQFTLTINGSSFDPNTVQILVFGTNCGPCTVLNGVLTTKTVTQIAGPVTLSSGSFNITVQNGSGGGPSNSLSLTVGAAAQEPNWGLKSSTNAPLGRTWHAMAYDVARGQVVLFGGLDTSGIRRNDTWVWDGTNWTQRSPANSPTPRYVHAMAYDAARGQVVLFGGSDKTGYSGNDTWIWDGTNWTQKSPPNSPSPRSAHSMAYDAARGQVVLFGGVDGNLRNDTWVWDGTNWTQRSPANSPTPRYASAIAYDAARGQVVLFGGRDNTFNLNDTWVWDGTNWTQRSPANSSTVRGGHAMAYDAARGQVVLFGGRDNTFNLSDTWVWDGTNWTQKSPANSPSARDLHAMTYDTARRQVVLFGGDYNLNLSDTWVWPGSGGTCTFTVSAPGLNISSTAFTGYLSVMPSSANCPWTATATSTGWLQLTSGLSGTTTGRIGYSVSANPTTTVRTGTITVGGQVFTVTQEGVPQGVTPFTLTATPRCWTGDGAHPAGTGIALAWNGPDWSRKYEVLRDRQVIANPDQSPWFNVTGLTLGQSYTYQIRASNSSTSVISSQVTAVAPTGCSTTTVLKVEDLLLVESTLVSGTSTIGKVRLSAVAPKGGAFVILASSNANLTVQPSVTVPEGLSSGSFTATAKNVPTTVAATIVATLGSSSATTPVTLKPTAVSGTGIAYLFLHGLNSDPGTWKDLIDNRASLGYCDHLKIVPTPGSAAPYRAEFYKQITKPIGFDPAAHDKPANGCFALEFNSLPDWDSGDGLDYTQLGQQVGAAVTRIVNQRHPSAIVFVGHSRGGLAARAFLQQYQSRNELPYKVGLITIGTPHRGSPFGRVKRWMDTRFTWENTTWVARENLKFVFSPSTGNFATYHDSSGVLQLCADPEGTAMCDLNAQTSRLIHVVSAAGQIVSTGMKLGQDVYLKFDVLTPSGTDAGGILPGSNVELRTYVFENITAGPGVSWAENTDGIVPAASQKLDAVASGISYLTSRYLDKIKHTSETGQTICINDVLDAVIAQPPLSGLALPVSSPETESLTHQVSNRSLRAAEEEQTDDPETAATRVRLRWLNPTALLETALEGDRLNNLEGLLSRREIRERDGAEHRELVDRLRQRLQNSSQETRAGAVRLLADVPAEYSAETVVELLRGESDPLIRRAAMKTVRTLAAEVASVDGRLYLSQSLQRLAEEATDADPETFLASVDSLVALGGSDEVEKLMDLYQRSNEGRKQLLAARMAALRNGQGAQRLAAYLTVDPDLQQESARLAGEVLSEISTEESVTGLLDWATGTETELQRSEALRWLKKVRTTRGKERLVTVLQQGRFKSEVLRESLQKQLEAGGQCTTTPATPIQ